MRRRQGAAGAALRRRPRGAAELALIVVDPDAGGFVHWTTYALPPEHAARWAPRGLPAGAREGENSAGKAGWTPPCPPSGNHHYEFRLYWLKRRSNLDAGAKPEAVDQARPGERGRQRAAGRPLRAPLSGRPSLRAARRARLSGRRAQALDLGRRVSRRWRPAPQIAQAQ